MSIKLLFIILRCFHSFLWTRLSLDVVTKKKPGCRYGAVCSVTLHLGTVFHKPDILAGLYFGLFHHPTIWKCWKFRRTFLYLNYHQISSAVLLLTWKAYAFFWVHEMHWETSFFLTTSTEKIKFSSIINAPFHKASHMQWAKKSPETQELQWLHWLCTHSCYSYFHFLTIRFSVVLRQCFWM